MSEIIKHENLTSIKTLKGRFMQLVALDIVMIPHDESWLRLYSKIVDSDGQLDIFKIDNGAGDHLFIVFSENGCIMKGFDHESEFSPHQRDDFSVWEDIYDETPKHLLDLLSDPMFEKDEVTFCIWRGNNDSDWLTGTIINPDNHDNGFGFLCGYLYVSAFDYCDWAKYYYGKELPLSVVEEIFAGTDIDEKIIKVINPDRDVAESLCEIKELYNTS